MQSQQEENKTKQLSSEIHLTKGIKNVDPKDLFMLQTLGTGGFGTVRLAKLKTTKSDWTKSDDSSTQEDSDFSHDSPKPDKQVMSEESKSHFGRSLTVDRL
jgi:hypothetical protein